MSEKGKLFIIVTFTVTVIWLLLVSLLINPMVAVISVPLAVLVSFSFMSGAEQLGLITNGKAVLE